MRPEAGKHGTPADMLRRDISMRCGSAVGNLLSDFACPARCSEAATPAAITSEVLGRATPVTVENPELSLGRVTVMPGAVLQFITTQAPRSASSFRRADILRFHRRNRVAPRSWPDWRAVHTSAQERPWCDRRRAG